MPEPSITDLLPSYVTEAIERHAPADREAKKQYPAKASWREARVACPEATWKTHYRCSRCGWYRPISSFSPRNHGCKPCQSEVMRLYRAARQG